MICRLGAFSIVRKRSDPIGFLTVRARVREDLEAFLAKCSSGADVRVDEGTDYKYRATVEREVVGDALFDEAFDVDYDNFKAEVARTSGLDREAVYAKVWADLLGLGRLDADGGW